MKQVAIHCAFYLNVCLTAAGKVWIAAQDGLNELEKAIGRIPSAGMELNKKIVCSLLNLASHGL